MTAITTQAGPPASPQAVARPAATARRTRWRLRPLPWLLGLLLGGPLYVLLVVAYQAALLDSVGTLAPAELEMVSDLGRLLAALGVALLGAGLWPRRWLIRRGGAGIAVLLLPLLGWLVAIALPGYLVDQQLIAKADAEARQRAFHAVLAQRQAIALAATVETNGITAERSDARFWAPWLGWLAYREGATVAEADVAALVAAEQQLRDQRDYARYRRAVAAVERRWRSYQRLSRNYLQDRTYIVQRIDAIWDAALADSALRWVEYRDLLTTEYAAIRAQAEYWAPLLFEFLAARSRCADADCRERLDQRYRLDTEALGYGEIEPDYWYQSGAEAAVTQALQARLALGVATTVQTQSGTAGARGPAVAYTDDVDHYEQKLRRLAAPGFIERSGGYQMGIDNIDQYRRHPATRARLIEQLAQQGVVMDADWPGIDDAQFRARASARVEALIDTEWRRTIGDEGSYLPPDLLHRDFLRHPRTQEQLQQDLGALYRPGMALNWRAAAFRRELIAPLSQRRQGELKKVLAAPSAAFAEGAPHGERGQQALRRLWLPTLALATTALLALGVAVSLPAKLVELRRVWAARRRPWHGKRAPYRRYRYGAGALLLAGLLLWPWVVTREAQPSSLQQWASGHSSVLSYQTLVWLTRSQQALYPWGAGWQDPADPWAGWRPLIPAAKQLGAL